MAHWTNEKIVAAWVDFNQRNPHRQSEAYHGNIGFRGPVLLSFHMAIACYHTGPSNRMYCLFAKETERRRSGWRVSNHGTMAYNECGVPHWRVHDINVYNLPAAHEANLLQMYANMREQEDRYIKDFRIYDGAVSSGMESTMRHMHDDIRHYVSCAGISSEPPDIDQRIEHVRYERMKRWWQWNDPKQVAKRERAAARKLAREALLGS